MPTALPPPRFVPWPNLRRAIWLRVRIMALNARMTWLPATHRQRIAGGRRWLAMSEDMFRLIGVPEPDGVRDVREWFTRPLPDGSTLLDPRPNKAVPRDP